MIDLIDQNSNKRNRVDPIAVVTGANGTLGRRICDRLVDRGYLIVRVDFECPQKLHSLSEDSFSRDTYVSLDVCDAEQWKRLQDVVYAKHGRVDCLVNCAGHVRFGDFGTNRWEEDKRVIEVNLDGTMLGCRSMLDLLRNSQNAHIINIASYSGFCGLPWAAAYTASKAGVIAFSECLANELREDDINVSVVCPAFFDSGLFDFDAISDAGLAASLRRVIDRSTLTAEQVAEAVMNLIDRPQLRVILPATARMAWRWKRLFPNWFLRSVGNRSHALRRKMTARLAISDKKA